MDNGIVRKVGVLSNGKITIPNEMRDILSIAGKDPFEIFTDEKDGEMLVILKKYYPGCVFCNTADDCIRFKDKLVCRKCLDEI